MTAYNRGDAGRRAAAEIRRNASELGISLREEMRHLGLNTNALLWTWEHGGHDLTSAALYALWLGGYDIVYIVTGVREAEPEAARTANAYQRKKGKMVTR